MDSLTHIIIGAALGEVILGKQIGRKAMAIGALAKSIPDFDLFYTGLKDPFLYVCHHRGHTHSLFWETLYSIPLAYGFYYLFKKKVELKKWFILFLSCLWGHSLLDVFTNYGTRLFLPFTNAAYSTNSISIADLFFTIPMLILLIIALFFKNQSSGRSKSVRYLLTYCVLYLCMTFANKIYANHLFEKSIQSENISAKQWMTNPTILNNFLWYAIAANDSNLYITENSLFFPNEKLNWMRFSRNQSLLLNHPDQEKSKVLQWFSHGYDISEQNGDTLNVYCVKFGKQSMSDTGLGKTFGFYYKLFGDRQMTMAEPEIKGEDFKKGLRELKNKILGN